jgi:hypothetical protein
MIYDTITKLSLLELALNKMKPQKESILSDEQLHDIST